MSILVVCFFLVTAALLLFATAPCYQYQCVSLVPFRDQMEKMAMKIISGNKKQTFHFSQGMFRLILITRYVWSGFGFQAEKEFICKSFVTLSDSVTLDCFR